MADPEVILHQLNYFKPLIDQAIKITEDYVSKHKLILTGGMAIDLALRMKGDSIYDDDALPDYDIISDKNLDHANELAQILCNQGFPDISVIAAAHITTVRVRIKRVTLLDATYIPPECYSKIPYLDVNHLRIIHPHYQLIDQRRSLSHLLEDTGLSLNVFNRLVKDVKRNNILRSAYPIDSNNSKIQTRTIGIPLSLIKVDEAKVNKVDEEAFVYTGNTCLAGYVGYLIMLAQYNNKTNWSIDKTTLNVKVPNNIPVRFLSCAIDKLQEYVDDMDKYRPLINIKPASYSNKDFEFVDTYGSRISCNIIKLSDEISVCVASVDYLLMEFLRDRIYVSEEPYSAYYNELVNVVDEMRDKDSHAIWWPSMNCYGQIDLPETKIAMIESIMDEEKKLSLKPRNSYPVAPKCAVRDGFQQTDSHYFLIDGAKDNKMKHTNYAYIMEAFSKYLAKKRIQQSKF